MTRRAHELIGDLRATDNLTRLDAIRRADGDYKTTGETAAQGDARPRWRSYVLPVLLCIAVGVVLAIVGDTLTAVSNPSAW